MATLIKLRNLLRTVTCMALPGTDDRSWGEHINLWKEAPSGKARFWRRRGCAPPRAKLQGAFGAVLEPSRSGAGQHAASLQETERESSAGKPLELPGFSEPEEKEHPVLGAGGGPPVPVKIEEDRQPALVPRRVPVIGEERVQLELGGGLRPPAEEEPLEEPDLQVVGAVGVVRVPEELPEDAEVPLPARAPEAVGQEQEPPRNSVVDLFLPEVAAVVEGDDPGGRCLVLRVAEDERYDPVGGCRPLPLVGDRLEEGRPRDLVRSLRVAEEEGIEAVSTRVRLAEALRQKEEPRDPELARGEAGLIRVEGPYPDGLEPGLSPVEEERPELEPPRVL